MPGMLSSSTTALASGDSASAAMSLENAFKNYQGNHRGAEDR